MILRGESWLLGMCWLKERFKEIVKQLDTPSLALGLRAHALHLKSGDSADDVKARRRRANANT